MARPARTVSRSHGSPVATRSRHCKPLPSRSAWDGYWPKAPFGRTGGLMCTATRAKWAGRQAQSEGLDDRVFACKHCNDCRCRHARCHPSQNLQPETGRRCAQSVPVSAPIVALPTSTPLTPGPNACRPRNRRRGAGDPKQVSGTNSGDRGTLNQAKDLVRTLRLATEKRAAVHVTEPESFRGLDIPCACWRHSSSSSI